MLFDGVFRVFVDVIFLYFTAIVKFIFIQCHFSLQLCCHILWCFLVSTWLNIFSNY